MTATDSRRLSYVRIDRARTFRHARCYAPDAVMDVLMPLSAGQHLALALDVDCLERSALARIDKVMLLALDALAHAGVQIVLVASDERDRASRLLPRIPESSCLDPSDGPVLQRVRAAHPSTRAVLITDQPALLAELNEQDRGIALGRPELVSTTVTSIADTAVRATLWWFLEMRRRQKRS